MSVATHPDATVTAVVVVAAAVVVVSATVVGASVTTGAAVVVIAASVVVVSATAVEISAAAVVDVSTEVEMLTPWRVLLHAAAPIAIVVASTAHRPYLLMARF